MKYYVFLFNNYYNYIGANDYYEAIEFIRSYYGFAGEIDNNIFDTKCNFASIHFDYIPNNKVILHVQIL